MRLDKNQLRQDKIKAKNELYLNQDCVITKSILASTSFATIHQLTMRQILNKSGPSLQVLHKSTLWSNSLKYNFSAMPPNIALHKAVQYQFKFRSILKLSQLNEYIFANKEDIKQYGKTILLQFLNEYPMQSFRRSRDEMDPQKREEKYKMRQSIYMFLVDLQGLNFYELNMRYSILKKLITYVGSQPAIIAEATKTEAELVDLLKTTNVHISDVMNWLYMLPLNYKQEMSSVAFDIIQIQFEKPQVREYFRNQRSLPALIKRLYQKDWVQLRKYKNIIRFFCYEASVRDVESLEEIVNQLQRLVLMKLHLVGEKVIPKIVDEIIQKFDTEFEMLTKNKQTLLRVFSLFKYLPLNYNIQFFNKLHNYLKSTKELPSHLLLYIPYNKLSQNEVSYLQAKMFAVGREDIASKLIYTIYQPQYREILTPFILKQAYSNVMEMWKKDNLKLSSDYQVYLSLIFRFSKINNPIIDQAKIKTIFTKMAYKIEELKYDVFNIFSVPAMIAFLELCALYDVNLNETPLFYKIQNVLRSRRERNSAPVFTGFLLSALKVHYNASHKKSRQLLTQFINQIANNPEVEFSQKIQLLFLIEKTMRPEPKWAMCSAKLYKELIKDIDAFVEIYIKYDHKTLKLTNFIFSKLQDQKVEFSTIIELLSSLNLKLITSLKGKLLSPLKKYIVGMDLSRFDISKSSLNSLVQCFRVLFYFKNEIPQFMEYFAIKLIEKIEQMCKQGEYVNGKQFASLSSYVMEVIANIQIKQKTTVIESIVSVIKTLRKKQGIYLKVYELDFLCNNQKYIKINQEVLDHHWSDIVETLKKSDRFEQHKQLLLIVIKLHCREFAELSTFDLRFFMQKCTQLIDQSALNLPQIKQCLGYDILNCEESFVIEKMKLFLGDMLKLAFRKDKRKHSYFMYQYYLKLFSKLQSREMIIEICQKLLYEKLYPVEVSSVVPILNKNEIKSKKFIKRILEIMSLSEMYVSYEKMQVLSWLEKIMYQLPENNFNLNKIKFKFNQEVIANTSALNLSLKNSLTQQNRTIQSGFQVDDPDFDKNYKIFIEYAWSSLKSKNVNTPQFKFICRYIFFSIEKIKARIENQEEKKLISKIKLYHLLKYIKEMAFFEVANDKMDAALREKTLLKDRLRKNKLLNKMEKDLSVMKIQPCEKLEKELVKYGNLIQFKFKHEVSSNNQKINPVVEFYVQQKNKTLTRKKFVIHTVKKYHCNPQIDSQTSSAQLQDSRQTQSKSRKVQDETKSVIVKEEEVDILDIGYNDNLEENEPVQIDELLKNEEEGRQHGLEETELSLEMKPQRELLPPREIREPKTVGKPLFSSTKFKKPEEKVMSQKVQPKFQTVLKLQQPSQQLYKDYNGYLKVEKSLIQLSTGLKCIIYDPERNIFFD